MIEIGTESEISLGMKMSKEAAFSQTYTEVITWRKLPFVNDALMTCHWLLHCIICCLFLFPSVLAISLFTAAVCPQKPAQIGHACTAVFCWCINLCTLPSSAMSWLVSIPRHGSTKTLIHQSAMHGRYSHGLHCTRR